MLDKPIMPSNLNFRVLSIMFANIVLNHRNKTGLSSAIYIYQHTRLECSILQHVQQNIA